MVVIGIMSLIMIACCMWWYADLYKIITNFNNKLLVKNKLINMCMATIINIVLLVLIIDAVIKF